MFGMRRWLYMATFLAVALLPLQAQIRGVPPSVTSLGRAGFAPCCGRVFVSGHIPFGHNPRFHVFLGDPFFSHRRFFFRQPFFFQQPIFVPWPVYGGASYPMVVQTASPVADPSTQRELARELERLREEVERLREEQDLREQRRVRQRENEKPQPAETDFPVTMFVFRDGHVLTTRNYAIVGPTLWLFSERRARKIPLSELDLDSTAKVNEERGVEFRLPSRQKAK